MVVSIFVDVVFHVIFCVSCTRTCWYSEGWLGELVMSCDLVILLLLLLLIFLLCFVGDNRGSCDTPGAPLTLCGEVGLAGFHSHFQIKHNYS